VPTRLDLAWDAPLGREDDTVCVINEP